MEYRQHSMKRFPPQQCYFKSQWPTGLFTPPWGSLPPAKSETTNVSCSFKLLVICVQDVFFLWQAKHTCSKQKRTNRLLKIYENDRSTTSNLNKTAAILILVNQVKLCSCVNWTTLHKWTGQFPHKMGVLGKNMALTSSRTVLRVSRNASPSLLIITLLWPIIGAASSLTWEKGNTEVQSVSQSWVQR